MQLTGQLQNSKDLQMGKVLLSIGHGFSASVLGAQLIKDGWTVYGTTRSVEKAGWDHRLIPNRQ